MKKTGDVVASLLLLGSTVSAWGHEACHNKKPAASCKQSLAQEACCMHESEGRFVSSQTWHPESKSWLLQDFWQAKCDGSHKTYCDKGRKANVAGLVVHDRVKELLRHLHLYGVLADTASAIRKTREVTELIRSTDLSDRLVPWVLEQTNVTSCLRDPEQDAWHLEYMDMDLGQTLRVMMQPWAGRDSQSLDDIWGDAWLKHGTCVSALKPNCYREYQPGDEVAPYFDRLAMAYNDDYVERLGEAGIVPCDSERYELAEFEEALVGNTESKVRVICHGDVVRSVQVFYKVKERDGQQGPVAIEDSLFALDKPYAFGNPKSEESQCPDKVRYMATSAKN